MNFSCIFQELIQDLLGFVLIFFYYGQTSKANSESSLISFPFRKVRSSSLKMSSSFNKYPGDNSSFLALYHFLIPNIFQERLNFLNARE